MLYKNQNILKQMRGSANASENFKKISKIVENCLEVGQILKKKKNSRESTWIREKLKNAQIP